MSLITRKFANHQIDFKPKYCIYAKILFGTMLISALATLLIVSNSINFLGIELLSLFLPTFFLSFFFLCSSYSGSISWSLYSKTDRDGKTREVKVAEFYKKINSRDDLFHTESLTVRVSPGINGQTVTSEKLEILHDEILLHSLENLTNIDSGRHILTIDLEIQMEGLPDRLKLSLEEMS
jgi:hypothetical protein